MISDLRRTATPTEIGHILERVASAPFNLRLVPVHEDLRGRGFLGDQLRDRADSLTAHLAMRVLLNRQWAEDTTREEFLEDIRRAALHSDAKLAVFEARQTNIAAVVAPTPVPEDRLGLGRGEYLVVIYSANRGTIISAYQSNSPTGDVTERSRWIR